MVRAQSLVQSRKYDGEILNEKAKKIRQCVYCLLRRVACMHRRLWIRSTARKDFVCRYAPHHFTAGSPFLFYSMIAWHINQTKRKLEIANARILRITESIKEERESGGIKQNLSGWLTFPCKQTTNSEDEGATLTSKAQLPHRFTMSAYQPEILAKSRKKALARQ